MDKVRYDLETYPLEVLVDSEYWDEQISVWLGDSQLNPKMIITVFYRINGNLQLYSNNWNGCYLNVNAPKSQLSDNVRKIWKISKSDEEVAIFCDEKKVANFTFQYHPSCKFGVTDVDYYQLRDSGATNHPSFFKVKGK